MAFPRQRLAHGAPAAEGNTVADPHCTEEEESIKVRTRVGCARASLAAIYYTSHSPCLQWCMPCPWRECSAPLGEVPIAQLPAPLGAACKPKSPHGCR
eukprot:243330-Rhodomonas_salina.3